MAFGNRGRQRVQARIEVVRERHALSTDPRSRPVPIHMRTADDLTMPRGALKLTNICEEEGLKCFWKMLIHPFHCSKHEGVIEMIPRFACRTNREYFCLVSKRPFEGRWSI